MSNGVLVNEYNKQMQQLLSQTRVSFLIGAGCSLCAGLPLMNGLTQQVCTKLDPDMTTNKDEITSFNLLKEIKSRYAEIKNTSIEDFLSEIQDIDAILQRQLTKGIPTPLYLSKSGSYERKHTQLLIKKIKENIVEILGSNISTIEYHRKFCRAIHFGLRKGRERTKRPVNYFILNYDTLFEDALALERVSFNDGFIGGSTAWWDQNYFYEDNSLSGKGREFEARVYKLHGSIDWIKPQKHDFPMRVRSSLPKGEVIGSSDGEGEHVVIYPASIKYKETQNDPFAQMMMSLREHLSETENHVLAIIGYGFNDEHINMEVKDGIRKSKGALSVIIFLGAKELPKCLNLWLQDSEICSQILILGKNGIWKNGEKILDSKDDIDWYKFEKISGILNG
ncbi:MAG: SIR2 family protein [Candidatus Methanoperedens sp.]